ncbi:hypothetical protein M5E88_18710 [Akkermansia muciniphila]|nr:hypothetical protein M5E88_18710 [Akkermansia muciniphila]
MSRYHGEQVLVVPRAAFEEAGYFQGHREGGDHYLNAFMKPGVASFMDREAAENDPSHKQIIAYAIFCHQGRILHYTRGGSGGEARLHDKGSIGIGGHINPVDRQSGHDDVSTYLAGVEREIREELVIDGNCTQRVLGVINDDTNDVGAVHLGIVHLFELDTDRVRANEAALANLRFVSPEELSGEMFEKLETWSQLALELFKNRGPDLLPFHEKRPGRDGCFSFSSPPFFPHEKPRRRNAGGGFLSIRA